MHDPSPAVVRQWARDRGLPVGERGRLSPDLVAAYLVAQRGSEPVAPTQRPAVSNLTGDRLPAPRSETGRRVGGKVVRARTPWNWPTLEASSGQTGGAA